MKRSMMSIAGLASIALLSAISTISLAQTMDETKIGPVDFAAGGGPSLSSDGKVAFNLFFVDNTHAFSFVPDKPNGTSGSVHMLPIYGPGIYTIASAISATRAVGWTEDMVFSTDHATSSDFGPLPQLVTGPSLAPLSQAYAVNDSGVIVGASLYSDPSTTALHAVMWDTEHGGFMDLNTFPVDESIWVLNQANGINSYGDVVGTAFKDLVPHAFLKVHGGHTLDLGTLPGGTWSIALGVNDSLNVVGYSGVAGDTTYHAFVWSLGKMKDLGVLPGNIASVARCISNTGRIGGWSSKSAVSGGWYDGSSTATRWAGGKIVNVNTFVSKSMLAGQWFIATTGVNDSGQIAGEGIDAGSHFAYLLTKPMK